MWTLVPVGKSLAKGVATTLSKEISMTRLTTSEEIFARVDPISGLADCWNAHCKLHTALPENPHATILKAEYAHFLVEIPCKVQTVSIETCNNLWRQFCDCCQPKTCETIHTAVALGCTMWTFPLLSNGKTNQLSLSNFLFCRSQHFAVNEMARLSWRGMAQTQGDWSPRSILHAKRAFWNGFTWWWILAFASFDERLV